MKTLGIILAAGKSTRLYPATLAVTKQLLPIYDKPLIYYPLSVLMLSGIRDIIIICSPQERETFKRLFENSQQEMGINISTAVQYHPAGIPDAFKIVKEIFTISNSVYDNVCLILGDNIYYGSTFSDLLKKTIKKINVATIFAHKVADPERFGVVNLVGDKITEIAEKPQNPISDLAVTGLYFYPMDVFEKAYELLPSKRGEMEITDLNNMYLKENRLELEIMRRGMCWFDAGTPDSLLEASHFVQTIQKNQDVLINSPHEIAYRNNWIDKGNLLSICEQNLKNEYYKKIKNLIGE
jgi:glucose-1-phosphate thymidylyltransferase